MIILPPVEKHIESSTKRTGKEFRELHLWIDSSQLGLKERLKRHDILEIPNNFRLVEKQFGKEAAKEFLQHIKDDYEKTEFGIFLKIFGKILQWFG